MKRDSFIDNTKVLLIFLVVFGHVIQPFVSELDSMQLIYYWIYTFHMPAFVLLSGLFAKGLATKSYISKLMRRFIYPYLVFQLLYTGYYFSIGMDDWATTLFRPQWSLWFLLSVFCWHLLLIIFKQITPVLGIMIAITFGVTAGFIDQIGHTFSLSRTFVFFPFFLSGYWISKEQLFSLVKQKFVRGASLCFLTAVTVVIWIAPEFSTYWLLGSQSYVALGADKFGGVIRLGYYGLAFLMIISFLAWVPNKTFRFTSIGKQTLYVYLLHGIFIQYFRETDILKINHVTDVIGLVVISCAIVLFLSSKPIIAITQPLLEGKITILSQTIKNRYKEQRET